MKKHPKKHIYTKQQNQNQPIKTNKLKEEICFILKMYYSLEHKKVDKGISCHTIDKQKAGEAN